MSYYNSKMQWLLMLSLSAIIIATFTVGLAQAQEVVPTATDQMITIKKQFKFDFANPNTDVDYQVVVTNTGAVPISNIVMTDSWPSTFVVNSLSGGFITWTIPSLLPGQSDTKNLQLHLPAETLAGNYTSKAMFISQQPALQKTLDSSLEVRAVTILSSELPGTDGFTSLYFYAGALLVQLSIIASLSLTKFLRL